MKAPAEFSRPIAIEGIAPDKKRQEKVEATAQECAALCKRFDLRGLENFKATINIRRVEGGEVVHVEGKVEADVVQTCVVSLLDVFSRVENEFETFFSENAPDEDEIVDGNEDAPELLHNGMLDLGEVAAQYLSLGINPYPRAPGVSLAAQLQEIGGEVKNSPFAVLQGLKPGEKPAAKKPAPAAPKPAAKKSPAPVAAKSEGVKKAAKAAKPEKSGKPDKKKKGK